MFLYHYRSASGYGGIKIGVKKTSTDSFLVAEKTKRMNTIVMKKTDRGLAAQYLGKNYNLIFPTQPWNALPTSLMDFFAQEFGFLSTATLPLVSEIDNLHYSTPQPLFENDVKEIIVRQIPGIADDYHLDTQHTIDRFNTIQYSFTGPSIIDAEAYAQDGAVALLSCGKDSLLTLGLARELDIDITPIHINDTTTPYENRVLLEYVKKIQKHLKINIEVVTNTIEKLNDFETWNTPPSCLGYSHMITAFCFLALPFLHNHASMVLLGNQQNMNFSFRTKQGYLGYPSYDQTTTARHQQEKMLKYLHKHYRVLSLVEPLTDIAEMKILFSRYPKLAKYQFSCNCLNGTKEKRWCHACNKCARLSLLMRAHGIDIKSVGLRSMLSRRFMKYYPLFGASLDVDRYEKSTEARDQQLLAFYMAYKNGVKGQLIDDFKTMFLPEAVDREDELRKKLFKIYQTDLPNSIRLPLHAIFKEEFKDLQ